MVSGGMERDGDLRHWGSLWIVSALFFVAISGSAEADQLGLNANWQYGAQGNDETQETFLQNYNVDFSEEISEAISANGALRYTRSTIDGREVQLVSPTAGLSVTNDIFRFGLSGAWNERMQSFEETEDIELTSQSWEATWSSAWRRQYWPGFRAFYGESRSWDHESPRQTNTDSSNRGINMDWEVPNVKVYYGYYNNNSTDRVTLGETETDNHIARLEAGRGFWNDRLRVAFSQQYTKTRSDSTVIGTAAGGGSAEFPVTISLASSGLNDTPDEGEIPSNLDLIDGEFFAEALVIDPNEPEPMNIGMEFSIPLDADETYVVYLYTVEDIGSPHADEFRWDAYVSNNGRQWTRERSNILSEYNAQEQRLEVEVQGVQQRHLKLVAIQTRDESVAFSEVRIFRRVEAEPGEKVSDQTTFENYETDVSCNFSLTTNIDLGYSFYFEKGLLSPGSDRERQAHTGTVQWTPSQYFTPRLSASETREKIETDPEDKTRSYALSIASSPLPTMDLSLGATRSESFEGGTAVSATDSYSIFTTASLFPDLVSSLDVNYTTSDNKLEDETTRSIGTRLIMTARLSPKLTLDATGDHSRSMEEDDTTSEALSLGLNWRPADELSLRADGSRRWEDDGLDTTSANVIVSVAPTEKTQVSLGYGYAYRTSTTHNFDAFGSWAISRFFSTQISGSYQITEEDEPWNVIVQLTARF